MWYHHFDTGVNSKLLSQLFDNDTLILLFFFQLSLIIFLPDFAVNIAECCLLLSI